MPEALLTNAEGVVAIAKLLTVPMTPHTLFQMTTGILPTDLYNVEHENDELSLTLHYVISNQQVVNALPASIRSTVMRHANGEESCVKVVGITPSQVVLRVSNDCNAPDTTGQTRTPSTTNPVTSTASATIATIDGTRRTTRTTTRTSRSSTRKK